MSSSAIQMLDCLQEKQKASPQPTTLFMQSSNPPLREQLKKKGGRGRVKGGKGGKNSPMATLTSRTFFV